MPPLSCTDIRKVSLLPSHVYGAGLGSCSRWLIKKNNAKATRLHGQSAIYFQSVELTGFLELFNRFDAAQWVWKVLTFRSRAWTPGTPSGLVLLPNLCGNPHYLHFATLIS